MRAKSVHFISIYSVLNKLSQYIYFHMPKNIASYTFLLVFKFFEYLRYILISFAKVSQSLFFDKIIGVKLTILFKKKRF